MLGGIELIAASMSKHDFSRFGVIHVAHGPASRSIETRGEDAMTYQEPMVRWNGHRIYVRDYSGQGPPIVLLHGFPDNVHLYDRLVPYLAGRRRVVTFDFLGWGASDRPTDYRPTAASQALELDAVIDQLGLQEVVLVPHDASGPPAIDWALGHPERVARLVLLDTYYQWTPRLRRPPAIALYSTPLLKSLVRWMARRFEGFDRRLYFWQVGRFISDPQVSDELVPLLYSQWLATRPFFLGPQRRPPEDRDVPPEDDPKDARLPPTRPNRVRR